MKDEFADDLFRSSGKQRTHAANNEIACNAYGLTEVTMLFDDVS